MDLVDQTLLEILQQTHMEAMRPNQQGQDEAPTSYSTSSTSSDKGGQRTKCPNPSFKGIRSGTRKSRGKQSRVPST